MDDRRGHLTPKVVHSSPDLPRLSYGSRACLCYESTTVEGTLRGTPASEPPPTAGAEPATDRVTFQAEPSRLAGAAVSNCA